MEVATIDRSKVWTVDDYLKLEEGLLAQLIDGELIMSPAPTTEHQRIIKKLTFLLEAKLEGEAYFAPVDLFINENTVLQPDLVFISPKNKGLISQRGIEGAPDIVMEVISPSNSFIDRNTKKQKYLAIGVQEYWIVDPGNQTLEIYTPKDHNQPILYLAGQGNVKTTLNVDFEFELADVFKR